MSRANGAGRLSVTLLRNHEVPGCSVHTGMLIRQLAATARSSAPLSTYSSCGATTRLARFGSSGNRSSTSVAVRPVAAAASTNHVAMSVMKPLPPPATKTATSLRVAPSPAVIATGGRGA